MAALALARRHLAMRGCEVIPLRPAFRTSSPRPTWRTVSLTALCVLGANLSSCIDPDSGFDEFVRRRDEASKSADAAGSGAEIVDAGSIYLPEPGQMNGKYLYVVDLDISPGKPTIYELDVKAEKGDHQYTITLRERPLKYHTHDMPVGDWSDWTSSTADVTGVYTTPPITVDTPATANSAGLNVTSELVFVGNVGDARYQDDDHSKHVESFCGTVSGQLTSLAGLATRGTFSATYISDPNNLPDVVLGCSGKKPAW